MLQQVKSVSVKLDQETGLHVTSEAVDVWLSKLESGQDIEPPRIPRLIWSPSARLDVQRLYRFLAEKILVLLSRL